MLITLIGIEGSSYRLPGAQLLVGTNGDRVGTISGGCLEATVVREAEWKIRGGAAVQRYSTVFDDLAEMPFGSGCGGVVELLMEPTATSDCEALMLAIQASLAGAESTVLTWLPTEDRGLMRAILAKDGKVTYKSAGLTEEALSEAIDDALGGNERLRDNVIARRLKSPQRLFIIGAGDDAKPLCDLTALMGWTVSVMDGRSHLATAQRFPGVNHVRVISSLEITAQEICHDDAVVLMTHSFDQDRDFLAAILPLRPKYLGLLGARRRSSLLLSEVAAMLDLSVADCCNQIHAPIGLDLGGDGSEAIALAIVAEIQACCMGKLPGSRKLSPSDVETFARMANSTTNLIPQCSLELA